MFDVGTYTSTFNSTLATSTATYTGDGTRTTYKAVLVADGLSSGAADPVADAYVSYLARADAIQAAFAAADASASTKWITIQSYGSGARPVIQPNPAGVGTRVSCIRFNTHTWAGGVKIKGVDCDTPYVAGITNDLGRGSLTPHAEGLWIEDVHVTNASGEPTPTPPNQYPGVVAPYTQFVASGITTTNLDYQVWKNVEIDHSDAAAWMWGAQQTWITGANMHDLYVEPLTIGGLTNQPAPSYCLTFVENLLFESSTINNVAQTVAPISGNGPGFLKGEAGFVFAHAENSIIRGNTISNINLVHADGIAIDYEGRCVTIGGTPSHWTTLIKDNTFTSVKGPVWLDNDSTSDASSMMLWDNNTGTSVGSSGGFSNPIFTGTRTVVTDPRYVTRSNLARGSAIQKIFGGSSTLPYSPTSDTPIPTGMSFGTSNVVHFP